MNPQTQQVVVVGDAKKTKPILKTFGHVEVYDAEGKLQPSGN